MRARSRTRERRGWAVSSTDLRIEVIKSATGLSKYRGATKGASGRDRVLNGVIEAQFGRCLTVCSVSRPAKAVRYSQPYLGH